MPHKLAGPAAICTSFWYHPNVSPPKDYAKWDDLITEFTQHLVDRYGIDEVASWYFEVWNEPNLDFWAGTPSSKPTTSSTTIPRAHIKAVSPRLRVGGPATAQAAWVGDMIRARNQAKIPARLRFHPRLRQRQGRRRLRHRRKHSPRQMVCRAVKKVHDEIESFGAARTFR